MEPGTRALTVSDHSTDAAIAFTVQEDGETFTDYGVTHTKEMHLIVVRDDLRHFVHLHPDRTAGGEWSASYSAPAAGTYWLYADFVEKDGSTYTIKFDRTYGGDKGPYGLQKEPGFSKKVDGYTITVEPRAGDTTTAMRYTVTNADGTPAVLENYLGAKGHTVFISPEGSYTHAHPIDSSNTPVFEVIDLVQGFYRVFTQFQITGKVRTVSFDWDQL